MLSHDFLQRVMRPPSPLPAWSLVASRGVECRGRFRVHSSSVVPPGSRRRPHANAVLRDAIQARHARRSSTP